MGIEQLTEAMNEFVRKQGWYQPDSPRPQTARNLAMAMSVEAAEVLELFHWDQTDPPSSRLESELADVTLYLLQLASVTGIDLEAAVREKLATNYERSWPDE